MSHVAVSNTPIEHPATFLGSRGLAQVLADLELTCLDVGARGGFTTDVLPLASSVNAIGFEPDVGECQQLNEDAARGRHPWRSLQFLPTALGRQHESQTLNLYRYRACSSLYEANVDVAEQFGRADWFDLDATFDVPTMPLDHAAERFGFADASFLKLDVQGGELDVLASGEHLLATSLLAIRTEVEFVPIYRNQPLFSDVDQYLRRFGFIPMGLVETHEWRRLSRVKHPTLDTGPIPYSRGQLVHADVLFFRDPAQLGDDGDAGIERLLKLAFLALAYGYVDYASAIVTRPCVAAHLRSAYGLAVNACLSEVSHELARRYSRARWASRFRSLRHLIRHPTKLRGELAAFSLIGVGKH